MKIAFIRMKNADTVFW